MTAGGFDGTLQNHAMFTEFNAHPQPDSRLMCNVEETDFRIWLHVLNSAGDKELVLSLDACRCLLHMLATHCGKK